MDNQEISRSAPRTVPAQLHAELCRLGRMVQMDNFLSENSLEDDYLLVVEEAIVRIDQQPSSSSPPQAAISSKPKLSKQDLQLLSKSKQFEDELLSSLQQVDKRDEWYHKYKRLAAKMQKEKSHQAVLEDFAQSQNKKITVLVDHIEKLMKALKIENTKRLKMADESRRLQKEGDGLRAKLEKQLRIIATQNRAIREVTEGSKVLEDQLKLMDEKFLELRAKLDITRDHLNKQIKNVKKESMDLRVKYAQAMNGASLDRAKVDEQPAWMTRPESASNNEGRNSPVEAQADAGKYAGVVEVRDVMGFINKPVNRSRSVDFIPATVYQTQSHNTAIRSQMSPEQLQMQQQFLSGLKIGLPPQTQPVKTASNSPGSPSHRAASPDLDKRPGSAQNTKSVLPPSRGSSRPKSALYQDMKSRSTHSSKSIDDRILTHVVRKIERKDGNKGGGWTADRIIELLEG